MSRVRLHDKEFKLLISSKEIEEAVKRIAERINSELKGEDITFICVLNGAFMFASDLLKQVTVKGSKVSFIKVFSYEGTESTGIVKEVFGLEDDYFGKTVVIIEDIVDTGRTLREIIKMLKSRNTGMIKVASLVFKPGALKFDFTPDYAGFKLPNDFIVGYGLDYDQLGRNLKDIYVLDD